MDGLPSAISESFGRRVGVSRRAVDRYRYDGRVPKAALMHKIVRATGGEVTAADFYAVPKPTRRARAS